MLEVNITIHCPDLVEAAKLLSHALVPRYICPPYTGHTSPDENLVPGTEPLTEAPTAAPVAQTAPAAPVAPAAPAAPAAPVAPTAAAPQITLAQLAAAGAKLIQMDVAKQQPLMALLREYGVQSVMQLKPDQIGAFATAMRGLGATI